MPETPSPPLPPAPSPRSARAARLRRLKRGLPRQNIARRSGAAPKNPFFARAGGSAVGGPLPAGRATRGLTWIVVGALSLICGRWYFTQKFDLGGEAERLIRAQMLPQLERQLGAKIEVGALETDWLGRVTLRRVVIGRNAQLPTGALAQVKSITIGLDLPGLALRRVAFPAAIRSVALENPQIYLRRDKSGLNWAKLLGKQGDGAKVAWTGRISATGGRIYYLDTALSSASGQPLILDARGVDATFDALAGAPYQFAARSKEPFFGPQQQLWNAISTSGTLETDFGRGLISLESRAVPLRALGDFAFPKRDVVVRDGDASGRVQLTLRGGALSPHGSVTVRRSALTLTRVRQPNSSRPLQIDGFDGPLLFAGQAFSTTGARFRALDTDFRVAGAASLQRLSYDVQLSSNALSGARLRQIMPASAPQFSLPATRLETRISGTAAQVSASGTLDAPQARLRDATRGLSASFPRLRAAFALSLGTRQPARDWRLSTRFSTAPGTINTPQGQLNAALQGTFRGAPGAGMEIDASAQNFALQSPRFGASRGQNLQISASTASFSQPRWSGNLRLSRASTSGLKWAALSAQAARLVQKSGELSGSASFAGLDFAFPEKTRAEATFALTGLDLNAPALVPAALRSSLPLEDDDFRFSAVRGRLRLAAGTLEVSRASAISSFGPLRLDARVPLQNPSAARLALSLPSIRLAGARFSPFLRAQNLALSGDWRGRLSLLSGLNSGGRYGLDFDLQTDAATARGLRKRGAQLALTAPRLRGRADFDARNPARSWNGAATIQAAFATVKSGTLGRFAALPAALSGAQSRDLALHLVARADGGRAPRWNADFSARSLSAPLNRSVSAGARRGAFVTLTRARAALAPAPGGLAMPRFEAGFGSGNVVGTAKIENGAPRAQLLAQNLDLAAVQRLFAPTSLLSARLSGRGDAALQIAPGAAPRAQLRLARGQLLFAPRLGAARLPLEAARADVAFENGGVEVQNAVAWSQGARLSASANLGALWNGQARISGLNLERLASFPAARALQELQADGLLGGDFSFQIDPNSPQNAQISGPVSLRLATVMGASLDGASAQIRLQNSASGWQFAATKVAGTVEDAPFSGEISASSAADAWRVKLETRDVRGERLARLGALRGPQGTQNRAEILGRALPVSGVVSADIDLRGTLGLRRGGGLALAPRAQNGYVRLSSGPLDWRGRAFGTLRADLEVENGVARAKTLELARPGANGDAPLLTVSGQLPLDSDSRALDAKIRVAQAPLSFFTEALEEGRDALRSADVEIPLLERALTYVAQLPAGTTGRVALEADLQGAWRAPRVHVTRLTLRDGRTRVPAGGYSPPATLDAAFTLENGAVTVEQAEFRLKKAVSSVPVSTAPASDDEDDTLLRIEPGARVVPSGEVALSADVFNANLSQLSTWVPALRDQNGGPLLRGELTEFSFRVGGQALSPVVTGSIQAENLVFNAYTLDRLRVSRFDIGGAAARIEPGNLSIVKGAFQSSSAYGTVPWSWAPLGPVRGGLLDVHFPLQTRDFGALSGVFVPALAVANADEFGGSIDVTGTLEAPQITGAVSIKGGQLRLDSRQNTFEAGLTNLSGTVRFVGGNQLLIDAEDPLRGRFVPASAVVGRPTRREDGAPTSARPAVAAGGPDPKTRRAPETANEPKLGGEWVLRGGVTREVRFDERALLDPISALSRLRYDLVLALDKGLYAAGGLPGVEDVSLGLIWKTGAGDTPETEQNLRWMLAARGQKPRKLKTGGQMTSFGSLRLPPDFAAGVEALGRARPRDFAGETDFAELGVRKRIDFSRVADRRTQVVFQNFAAALTGAGSGVVDGRLVLDNRASVQQAPGEAVGLQRATLTGRGSRPALFGPSFEPRTLENAPSSATRSRLVEIQDDSPGQSTQNAAPLRLGGTLTLESAEIYGAPAGGEGGALLLSRLPVAPIFDVKLSIGRDVQIVTSAFRAGLDGEIVVSGSPRNPQILGVLQTLDGQVRFPNARARVEEGRVSIAINRNPETDGLRTRVEIDATARGQAGAYTIVLRMRGPLDLSAGNTQSLNIDVTSNPPLSQNEAFEQLLGTVPGLERQDDGTLRPGSANRAYTNAIVNVLSAPLFAGVEQTLAQTLGLTSVGFQYRFNEPLAIQFTKALGDRVFLSYRRSLGSGPTNDITSNANRRTPFELRIEYRIKGDYLLGLQTDERQFPSITLQRSRRF